MVRYGVAASRAARAFALISWLFMSNDEAIVHSAAAAS